MSQHTITRWDCDAKNCQGRAYQEDDQPTFPEGWSRTYIKGRAVEFCPLCTGELVQRLGVAIESEAPSQPPGPADAGGPKE